MTLVTSAALIENGSIRVKAARHGLMAFGIHDTFVGRSIDLYGEWSPDDARVMEAFVRPGMTVLDIGANIGAHTLFLANAVGPMGRVVAFEPARALFQLLCCNVALNGLAQVRAIAAAAGRERGTARVASVQLDRPGNFGGTALVAVDGEEVPVLAVDDLALPGCDLIKADVEGMEGEVVSGAARTIARFKPVLLLENDEPERSPALIARLLELGYRLYWHSPPLFSPDNFYRNPTDAFPGLGSLNLLCLPDGRDIAVEGLKPVEGPDDWPPWWPNWAAQG